jgi:RNA polymerase sigma-70 factor (ECF subfamily)
MAVDPSLGTTQLHSWLDRMRQGDRAAADALVRRVYDRLQILTRAMLRRFPNVRRWVETDEVYHGALMRLLETLNHVRPNSARHFYGLAGFQIRQHLLDLARHYRRREQAGLFPHQLDPALPEPADPQPATELERWLRFHELVEGLPDEEREVVTLVYYHGWTQLEAAKLLEISDKTVRRRLERAFWKIGELASAPTGGSDEH